MGWTHNNNLGDEVIFAAFKKLFGDIFTFRQKNGLSYFNKIMKNLHYDLLFFGGGQLINKTTSNPYEKYGYYTLFKEMKANRKIIFGTGVIDPSFWKYACGVDSRNAMWAKLLNEYADYIGVRGAMSREFLLSWGVKKPVKIIGDLSLIFSKDRIQKKKYTKTIGINISSTSNILWGKNDDIFLNKMVKVLSTLKKEGWDIRFFPVCPKDLMTTQKIAGILNIPANNINTDYLSLTNFFAKVSEVDVFVGEKLHSTIFALCTHTPAIMLDYRPKCYEFMESFDLLDYNIRIDKLKVENLLEKIDHLYNSIDILQKHIHSKCSFYKKLLQEEAKTVMKLSRS